MKYKILLFLLSAALLGGCTQSDIAPDSIAPDNAPSSEFSSSHEELKSSEDNGSAQSSTAEESEVYVLNFEASTIDGAQMTSEIFADSKLTMINVWATYCNPCLSEMPDLGEIANEYDPATFQMLGIISDVTEDDASDKLEEAKSLITETGADYPHLLLNQSLYSNLVGGVSGVPTTFFFNQESELLGYLVGAQSKEVWISIIEDLLSQMEE